jgi:DTW domain-containing protein
MDIRIEDVVQDARGAHDAPRAMRSRRAIRCPACFLPGAHCICAGLPLLVPMRTSLVVVMHRREAITSTNTGRLAARLLAGSTVRVRGAEGASPRLPDLRSAPPRPSTQLHRARLLPESRRLALFHIKGARELSPADAHAGPVVLLVPDGTWSQARRMLRRDADLASAEPVTLPQGPPTRYGLRRGRREGGLSTLEAIARAMGVLEGAAMEASMLEVFDRFVERARSAREGRPPT